MEIWFKVNRIMRRQYGLITRSQLLTLGVPDWHAYHRIERGEWLPIRPGVYAAAAVQPTREQAHLAVVLAVGGTCLVSHLSSAQMWGSHLPPPEGIEVSAVLRRKIVMDGVVGHRSGLLFDEDIARCRGVPITSPARMLVDLSGRFSARELGPVLDAHLRAGMTLRSLRRCIGRLAPAPGRRPSVIHDLLAARLPGYDPGDSDLETRVLAWLTGAGLPPPRQQYRVRIKGRTYKLDLAYPGELVGLEPDGWDTHRTRTAFDYDRERANAFAVAGWLVLRLTSHSRREDVIAQVIAARSRFGQRPAA